VRHPRAYAERIDAGVSPAAGREVLDDEQRAAEAVLLGVRLVQGLLLDDAKLRINRAEVARLIADGLVDGSAALGRGNAGGAGSNGAGSNRIGSNAERPRLILTNRGRLLADAVVRALLS
jgi:oxygen-independent coproporphyrinogen-3 oxidase